MKSKVSEWQIVRVRMKSERVKVVCAHVWATLKGARAFAWEFDQAAKNKPVFHDACPVGSYRDGERYEGNRRTK